MIFYRLELKGVKSTACSDAKVMGGVYTQTPCREEFKEISSYLNRFCFDVNQHPDPEDDPNLNYSTLIHRRYVFGFTTIKQLFKWFILYKEMSDDARALLQVGVYEESLNYKVSKKQSMFDCTTCKLVNTMTMDEAREKMKQEMLESRN